MKLQFPDIKANFITDAQGNKKSIVLDIEQFEKLMETLEDFYDIAQAAIAKSGNHEEMYTLEEVEKLLKERSDDEE